MGENLQRGHRLEDASDSYDYAILEAGASIVEIGNQHQTLPDELENTISTQTIAVFWFQGNEPAIRIILGSGDRNMSSQKYPVIVDAAAQLLPGFGTSGISRHQRTQISRFSVEARTSAVPRPQG